MLSRLRQTLHFILNLTLMFCRERQTSVPKCKRTCRVISDACLPLLSFSFSLQELLTFEILHPCIVAVEVIFLVDKHVRNHRYFSSRHTRRDLTAFSSRFFFKLVRKKLLFVTGLILVNSSIFERQAHWIMFFARFLENQINIICDQGTFLFGVLRAMRKPYFFIYMF